MRLTKKEALEEIKLKLATVKRWVEVVECCDVSNSNHRHFVNVLRVSVKEFNKTFKKVNSFLAL